MIIREGRRGVPAIHRLLALLVVEPIAPGAQGGASPPIRAMQRSYFAAVQLCKTAITTSGIVAADIMSKKIAVISFHPSIARKILWPSLNPHPGPKNILHPQPIPSLLKWAVIRNL